MRKHVEMECGALTPPEVGWPLHARPLWHKGLQGSLAWPSRAPRAAVVSKPLGVASEDGLVGEFLQEEKALLLSHAPQTFKMCDLLAEVQQIEQSSFQQAPQQAPGVAALVLPENDPEILGCSR